MIGLAQMMWRTAWKRKRGQWHAYRGGPFVSRERYEQERKLPYLRNARPVTGEYYAMVDRINRGEAP